MIGRIVHASDFQRLLATPAWSRSAHFAVHHLPTGPHRRARRLTGGQGPELSTDLVDNPTQLVDEIAGRHWLGAVLPKRLARRAVTRNLVRRQIRAALDRHQADLPAGLWVVRLRAGFARADFPSAASDALRQVVRSELEQALSQPAARAPRRPSPAPMARRP